VEILKIWKTNNMKTILFNSFVDKYLGAIVLWVIAFFSPVQSFVFATGLFVICDMVTGIIAAKKRGERMESKKLFRSIAKFLVYGVAIIVAHTINFLYLPNFPAVQLIAGFIAFIEVKSIDENISEVTGYSILGVIVSKLKSKK